MVSPTKPLESSPSRARPTFLGRFQPVHIVTALLFGLLFQSVFVALVKQWWNSADAGHGLLLAPVCGWLAYKRGRASTGRPQLALGSTILAGAVLLRFVGTMAGELFTVRFAMVLALVGLIVVWRGLAQLRWWWLPTALAVLAIPLPAVLLNTMAIPLQLMASKIGAALLDWRNVPHSLNGNVIVIPGFRLFVAEACSGLRSLTALISLGLLIGGLWLGTTVGRLFLILLTIPVAVLLNGARVFLTAFLIYYVDPELGQGFMHWSEGWLIFVIALGLVAGLGSLLARVERRFQARTAHE